MTRNAIIEGLFMGKNFNDCISRMDPPHLRDDLKMEVALVVCEWPDERIVKLHERKELEFFVVRVILNQIQSKTSPFYKKYRRENLCYLDDPEVLFREENPILARHLARVNKQVNALSQDENEIDERMIREQLEDYTMGEINSLYWYDRDILKLYMELGTFRAIQEKTGIPYISCYKNIQKSLETLRKKAEGCRGNPVIERNIQKYEICPERK